MRALLLLQNPNSRSCLDVKPIAGACSQSLLQQLHVTSSQLPPHNYLAVKCAQKHKCLTYIERLNIYKQQDKADVIRRQWCYLTVSAEGQAYEAWFSNHVLEGAFSAKVTIYQQHMKQHQAVP